MANVPITSSACNTESGIKFKIVTVNVLKFRTLQEMQTLNGALQEYERHFSGIWGHFPECPIFRHKSTKCTHKFLVRRDSIVPYFNFLHNIFEPSIGFRKGQRFV